VTCKGEEDNDGRGRRGMPRWAWATGWRGKQMGCWMERERWARERPRGEGRVFFLFSKSFFSFVYFRKPLLANCFEPAPTKVEFEYRVETETK
jgi:hypothetical protein